MNNDLVSSSWDGDVCRMTLSHPAHGNALGAEMVTKMGEVLDEVEKRQVKALVVEGAGRHFCTGFDVSGLAAETDDTLLARAVRVELLLQRIARAPFVTVAIAHGSAIGAGADLFACCQHRLVRSDASFVFPGMRGFGIVLGTGRLARLVGATQARRWLDSGARIGCEEAIESGLASYHYGTVSLDALIEASPSSATLAALTRAIDGDAGLLDARDLDLLVRSAAVRGLKSRLECFVERTEASRRKSQDA